MKHLLSISLRTFTLLVLTVLFATSCKKDKDLIQELTLEKATLELFTDDEVSVKINSGNGGYEVSSSAAEIATAKVSGQTVIISAKLKGTATITVKDSKGKSAAISLTVKSAIVDATTPRFKWTSTIELEKANGWGLSVMADRLAVTGLTDKKQYVLSWTGGYTVGDKTNSKLRILENGKTAEEITLTALEIQKAESKLFSIVFNKDAQKGEVVFTK